MVLVTMRLKLTILGLTLLIFSSMNIYSRALRHISIKDVKQKHQEKIVEKIHEEVRKKEERQYTQSVMETKKYDWRKELYQEPPPQEPVKVVEERIVKLPKHLKYDWRKELNEGMTSSGMFFTTLPATGDTDLLITTLDSSGYEVSADVSFSSGTNSGFTGGFSSDNGIINLSGEGDYSTGVVSNYVDLSTIDSINISAIAGNNSNGGMVPTRPLQVAFFTDTDVSDLINVISPSATSFTSVNINIPQQFRVKNVGIILYSNTSDGFGYHGRHFGSQTIPISGLNHTTISGLLGTSAGNLISLYLRDNKNTQSDFRNLGYFFWFNVNSQRFGWFDNVGTAEDPDLIYRTWPAAPVSGATTENNVTDADYRYIGQTLYNLFKGTKLYGISNVSFRRRTPMNVFVSLDSPEATSFIRTDPSMSNLSPAERQKKLREMLASGDEYVEKMLGADFPGTGAVPPGEYDPFKQAPAGKAGDTPGVDISNFDTSKMEKDYGQVAGSMNTPSGATKFMKDLMKDGFGGNVVKTTVNGQRMTGRPAEILQQIQLNFPGGV